MEDGCFHNAFVTPLSSQPIYEWFAGLTLAEWVAFSLAGNFAIFGLSVMMCAWIGNQFGHRRLFETRQPVARGDLRLALTAVLLNSLVAVVGWMLWKAGWIRITHPAWWRSVLDVVIFLGAMDFGMYVFHRLAHHRWIYPWIHSRHHTHESVNAISLFVLNPFEVLGFGALMISVMILVPLSGTAVLVYLALNVLFGTLGHAGVEPFPESWQRRLLLREIGSSTFHAGHHRTPTTNYGFYTLIWDRLFGTLARPNRPTFRP